MLFCTWVFISFCIFVYFQQTNFCCVFVFRIVSLFWDLYSFSFSLPLYYLIVVLAVTVNSTTISVSQSVKYICARYTLEFTTNFLVAAVSMRLLSMFSECVFQCSKFFSLLLISKPFVLSTVHFKITKSCSRFCFSISAITHDCVFSSALWNTFFQFRVAWKSQCAKSCLH